MSKISEEYGDYLATVEWDYTGVIRRHFALNELNSTRMIKNFLKHKSIGTIFYAIERDTVDDTMTHAHILLKTHGKYDSERLAKELGINKKAVFLEKVISSKGIGKYVSKHLGRDYSYHNIY